MKKKQATPTTQTPAPTPVPETPQASTVVAVQTVQPPVVSKQLKIIADLKSAWTKVGVNLEKLVERQDGKFINLQPTPDWPIVVVGASGGVSLPQIRSYPSAFNAAVNGLELLKKQREREQKKAATATATPAVKASEKTEVKPPTPSQKKQVEARV